MLLNDLHNPFFAEIADGLETLAAELGYRILLITGGRRPGRERAMLDGLLEYRTDGIILVSPRMRTADVLAATGATPTVVVGRQLRGPNVDCILVDEPLGAGSPCTTSPSSATSASCTSTAAAARAPRRGAPATARRCGALGLGELRGRDPGRLHRGSPACRRPRRCCAPARRCRRGSSRRTTSSRPACSTGSRTPAWTSRGDVSIVGYDNTFLAALHHMSLTSVDQPRHEMGRLALELLLERIDGRRKPAVRLMEPRLVVRGSSGPAAGVPGPETAHPAAEAPGA